MSTSSWTYTNIPVERYLLWFRLRRPFRLGVIFNGDYYLGQFIEWYGLSVRIVLLSFPRDHNHQNILHILTVSLGKIMQEIRHVDLDNHEWRLETLIIVPDVLEDSRVTELCGTRLIWSLLIFQHMLCYFICCTSEESNCRNRFLINRTSKFIHSDCTSW
jgi:hypothetical protein